MPIPHPRRRLGGGGRLDQRGHVRDWAPPGWFWEVLPSGGVGWWGASPSLTRSLFGGGRVGQWRCRGFRTPRRWYVTVSARRTSTSVATWLRWRAGSTIPGRFFRDLTGAMILWWFLIFGCPPPASIPVGRYGSSCISDNIRRCTDTKRWCTFAYNYWMHANLNTILYFMIWFCLLYDLVLLIECSYWISSPSFPCARQFDIIMDSGMKEGATYIDHR